MQARITLPKPHLLSTRFLALIYGGGVEMIALIKQDKLN
jgi:hypothetical protein